MKHRARVLSLAILAWLPAASEVRWMRLRSPGFELLSDASPSTARTVLSRLEKFRSLFESRTQHASLTPLPVRIHLFASEAEFKPFRVNPATAGYYQSGTDRDYIAMYAAGTDPGRIVLHEFTHLLLRHANVPVPAWFGEGTAELYSTTEFHGSNVRVGGEIASHIAALRQKPMLQLPDLFRVDNHSPHYNERDKTGIFYAESWALLHMLNFSPAYQMELPGLMTLLFAGEDPVSALEQCYRKSPASVFTDLQKYVQRGRFTTAEFILANNTARVAETSTVPEIEAELALADLLLAIHRPDDAERRITPLAVGHPKSAEIEAALGDTAVQRKEDQRGLEHYRRAMALGSTSGRLRFDYAMLLREVNAPDIEVLNALREASHLDPKLFDARFSLGSLLMQTGDYKSAAAELRAASELHPSAFAAWEQLALAYYKLGERDQARFAAQEARKRAQEPVDIARTDSLVRLTESSEIEPSYPRQQQPPSSIRAEGVLTQVDCLGQRARLHVLADGKKLFLLVNEPGSVLLRNSAGSSTEFACGPLPSVNIVIHYRDAANKTYGTAGEVSGIEFR